MLWIFLAFICVCLAYWLLIRPFNYWTKKNVLHKGALPLFGNQANFVFKRKSIQEYVDDVYYMFPGRRYSGFYQFYIPTLIVKDPELVKQIGVKDFDHFTDHRSFIPDDVEPLWGKNLFALKGEKWRQMRTTLSPSFTSSKMKAMFHLMAECAESFVKHFEPKVTDTLTIDMKDALTRFTNDVIATTAFGIKCDSLENRENKFYLMGKEATNFSFSFWKNVKFILLLLSPKIGKIVGASFFNAEVSKFFKDLVCETIKTREEKNIIRPDMIHLLMEARKGKSKLDEDVPLPDTGFATVEEHIKGVENKGTELTDIDITAQALIFFFAGFDSVATLMAFTSYELALNPDIQERLQREIDEVYENCNGKVTYEALMKMKYLDMVLSESLRKWPNAVVVDRVCTKPYTIEPVMPDEKPVHIDVGDVLWLPIMSIHRDKEYYENPEKFDPERFNDENKSKINPYAYLPFGVGPRNCIGSRFALLETKILYFHILKNFNIVPVDKTQIPLKISKKAFNLTAEKGFWLGLKSRSA